MSNEITLIPLNGLALQQGDRVRYTHIGPYGQRLPVEIRMKGDWRFLHLIVPALVWLVGLFRSEFKERFYASFASTLGSTVYTDITGKISFGLLSHELVHVEQFEEFGWVGMVWRYAWKSSRYQLELAATVPQVLEVFMIKGSISDAWIVETAHRLSGPMYFHMVDPKVVIEDLRRIARNVTLGLV